MVSLFAFNRIRVSLQNDRGAHGIAPAPAEHKRKWGHLNSAAVNPNQEPGLLSFIILWRDATLGRTPRTTRYHTPNTD